MNQEDLKKIAAETRAEFELEKVSTQTLKQLYQAYNHLENPDEFLIQAESLFPKLNCGLASLYLQTKIPKSRIVQGKYASHNHTYLQINDLILDITSDQFGGPKVYVGPLKPPWSAKQQRD